MKHYLLIPFLFLMSFSSILLVRGQDSEQQKESADTIEIDSSHSSNKVSPSDEEHQRSSKQKDPVKDSPFSYPQEPESAHDPLNDPMLKEPDSFQAKFLNMLFLLGLLIGFMLLASWFLRRMTRTRTTQLNQASAIKVLETRSLSPRATLYLLNVNGQDLLIAESPMGVSHLASLNPYEDTEEKEEEARPRRELPPYFSNPSKP